MHNADALAEALLHAAQFQVRAMQSLWPRSSMCVRAVTCTLTAHCSMAITRARLITSDTSTRALVMNGNGRMRGSNLDLGRKAAGGLEQEVRQADLLLLSTAPAPSRPARNLLEDKL
jgi:hypothetical protein